jgi:hypothetical protein
VEPPPRFSLSLERVGGAAFSSLRPSSADASYGVTSFGIAGPAANPVSLPRVGFDVILPSGLTLGAALGAGLVTVSVNPDKGDSQSETARAFILSPRIGYRIEVERWLDVTPRGGFTLMAAGVQTPDSQRCTFTGTTELCQSVQGDSASLFAVALSLEVLLAARITRSFNLLGGLAYDHVVSASGSSSSTDATGGRTSTDAKAEGKYLGGQLWLGLGGYF